MPKFFETKEAGHRAEMAVREVLSRYTKYVYSNIRVDTLYTKSGTTEIDIIAAVADVILIVEVKNLSSIVGSVQDNNWELTGLETGERYSALNVLTQNRIHVRSFKDAWFANRGELPNVISVVVVPNGCYVQPELAQHGVLTVQQFSAQVAKLAGESSKIKYGYALGYVVHADGNCISRKDFVGGINGKV